MLGAAPWDTEAGRAQHLGRLLSVCVRYRTKSEFLTLLGGKVLAMSIIHGKISYAHILLFSHSILFAI